MSRCEICAFAEERGFYPPQLNIVWHCPVCCVSGYGHSELHCHGFNGSGCGRTFGSETVFTAHQTDSGCRDPLNLKTKDGKRRFKAIERSGKLVWVRTDAYSDGDESKKLPRPRDRKKRSVACERGYVHRSKAVA